MAPGTSCVKVRQLGSRYGPGPTDMLQGQEMGKRGDGLLGTAGFLRSDGFAMV